jgi:hypothetical protein
LDDEHALDITRRIVRNLNLVKNPQVWISLSNIHSILIILVGDQCCIDNVVLFFNFFFKQINYFYFGLIDESLFFLG